MFKRNDVPLYDRPVPAVVVAPLLTTPPKTARPPSESAERRSGPERVDEAVEKNPPVNPRTVEVDAPYEVNGRM
jgi:hypothetical protein